MTNQFSLDPRGDEQWHATVPAMTVWAVRGHVEQGRRFWFGLARQTRVLLAVAVLLAAAVSVEVPATVFDHFFGG